VINGAVKARMDGFVIPLSAARQESTCGCRSWILGFVLGSQLKVILMLNAGQAVTHTHTLDQTIVGG